MYFLLDCGQIKTTYGIPLFSRFYNSAFNYIANLIHFLTSRNEFRPCYRKPGILSSIFWNFPFLALRATVTVDAKNEIVSSLGLMDPTFLEINPDRRNIFFSYYTRPSNGDEKLAPILRPLVHELLNTRQTFPLAIIHNRWERWVSANKHYIVIAKINAIYES